MNRSSRRYAPARVAVLLSALVAGAIAAPVVVAGPGVGPVASPVEVDAAVAFRAKLGFRTDRAYVATSFGKQGFSKAKWGVPLDATEAAEVGRRVKVQKDAGRALDRWATTDDAAGAYFDHGAKGAPVFLTTGDPGKGKAAVARVLPAGANARFVRVTHSMTELLAVQARVNADLETGALAALGVTSTAIDARSNAVAVGVAADTPAVRAALMARYGDAVEPAFELPAAGGDACSTRDNCSPAKAGIEIVSSYNGNNCTMGFLVRVVGSPEPRALTAGHCVGLSGGTGTSRKWSHAGINTWAEFSYWTDGADADVAVLAPDGSAIAGDRNLLYRASSSDIVHVTGMASNAQQIQGGLICRSGATSGHKCGTIELTNRTKDVDGRTIDHQWVVDFDACPGDSGGPVLPRHHGLREPHRLDVRLRAQHEPGVVLADRVDARRPRGPRPPGRAVHDGDLRLGDERLDPAQRPEWGGLEPASRAAGRRARAEGRRNVWRPPRRRKLDHPGPRDLRPGDGAVVGHGRSAVGCAMQWPVRGAPRGRARSGRWWAQGWIGRRGRLRRRAPVRFGRWREWLMDDGRGAANPPRIRGRRAARGRPGLRDRWVGRHRRHLGGDGLRPGRRRLGDPRRGCLRSAGAARPATERWPGARVWRVRRRRLRV